MEFINKSPLSASFYVNRVAGTEQRIGMITAKATYKIIDSLLLLVTDDPFPIYDDDQTTNLGILPRDNLPKTEGTDIILLGKAYAPGGEPVSAMEVIIEIGKFRRCLHVLGDRYWHSKKKISAPEPFISVPLTYSQAFGGKAAIEIADGSYVDVSDPRNPDGKGFDPEAASNSLVKR
ncbi:DUF2169 domain-containing protein, partial [bacterium]|nr:DUF2169 domain-containing protein [candidate division CSSED10-310 bacterium]